MLELDCKVETEKIVSFLKKTFKAKGFDKAVLGISGGLDSAVVANLLVRALDRQNVFGLLLPYGNQKDIEDSALVCSKLGIKHVVENINTKVISFLDSSICGMNMNKIRLGNICARVRMIHLFDLAALVEGLVVGTGNKTECLLGYCTWYGDSACSIAPIAHLYKTQVRQLAKYLKVPKKIIDKAPTAGLWEGQTDEGEIGMAYEEMDIILEVLLNPHCNATLLNKYVNDKELGIKVLKILERATKNEFKRNLPASIC